MSESTPDNGTGSRRTTLLSLSAEDDAAEDSDWGWGLKGKFIDSYFITQRFTSFMPPFCLLDLNPLPGEDLDPKQFSKQTRSARSPLSRLPPLSLSLFSHSLAGGKWLINVSFR